MMAAFPLTHDNTSGSGLAAWRVVHNASPTTKFLPEAVTNYIGDARSNTSVRNITG
jgi:hypothetical protein